MTDREPNRNGNTDSAAAIDAPPDQRHPVRSCVASRIDKRAVQLHSSGQPIWIVGGRRFSLGKTRSFASLAVAPSPACSTRSSKSNVTRRRQHHVLAGRYRVLK